MKKRSLQIIRDEHASLAAMLRSMSQMVERGPAEDARIVSTAPAPIGLG